MDGVQLDMSNTNTIITVAMLSAIYENHQKDYLDMIKPFVCNLLPARNQHIDFLDLKHRMESEYGFINMPIGVLKKIIARLCKGDNPLCVCYGFDQYRTVKAYDTSEFRKNHTHMKATCSEVSNALKDYLNNERAMNYSEERCTLEILRYLDQFGHRVLKNSDALRSLPVDERISRYIACFIQLEKEKNSLVYDRILELARGYMVYRSIYFFSQKGIEKSGISLAGVTVYLDTPLIINALGFDTIVGKQAVTDAIGLAKSLGARVAVLEHCVEEAQGILNAYISAYPRVQTFRLQALTIRGYSLLALQNISQGISQKLQEELDISIDAAPGLGSSSDWDRINTEEALNRYYIDSLQDKKHDEILHTRIENDVRTLSYALQLREGNRPKHFENCKVLVLSDSKTARQAAYALYDDYRHDEINIVYSLTDFSCIAWLASPFQPPEIAEDLLMYNSAAALDVADAVIEQMLTYVDELEELGEISENMAFLLRTHPSVRYAAAEITGNDASLLSPNMINEIYKKAVDETATKIASTKYDPQIRTLNEQNQIAAEALRTAKKKEEERGARLNSRAREKERKATTFVLQILTCLIRIIQFAVIGFVLYSVFAVSQNDSQSVSIYHIIAVIFSLFSVVDSALPKLHYIDKWIKKFAHYFGNWVYDREIKTGKKYLDV